MWFSDLKIRTRLVSSFIIVALVASVVGYTGIQSIREIERLDTELYENNTAPLEPLLLITEDFQKSSIALRDIVITKDMDKKVEYLGQLESTRQQLDKNYKIFEETMEEEDIQKVYQDFRNRGGEFRGVVDRIVELSMSGQDEEALLLLRGDADRITGEVSSLLHEIINLKIEDAEKKSDSNRVIADRSVFMMTVYILAALVLSITLGLLITRMITKPLNQMVQAAESIAAGDLRAEINISSKDELGRLGQAFSSMVKQLRDIVGQITEKSQMVAPQPGSLIQVLNKPLPAPMKQPLP
ncbi:hypothetical protein N752_27750 [Desulforamulus aquiferis]|nr:MCP four helix bundle domain-containing protein [Desulforamulus aquiferis]RYD01922.1 hypothetical protein N752_27750 [Desulforamulus aquiferis]